jgi:acyl-CoA thioesterase-2
MDPRSFLGLEPTDDPFVWRLEVTAGVSTPGAFLYGGCGLAAAIVVLEQLTERRTVWASAQYLSYAPTGSTVEFAATIAAAGRQTTQARVVGRLAGAEILTVNAALGRRPSELCGEWAVRPEVPSPDQSRPRLLPERLRGTVMERVETRLASGRQLDELDGTPSDGRLAMWARLPGQLELSTAALAVIGDLVPGGIGHALGRAAAGTSLDNTIRVARLVPSEWVLCDIRIHAVAEGYGHGLAHLWAEDGTLLGTASQSVVVRTFEF